MNTNKLQFLHHSSPFQTVEEAKGYVFNLIEDGSLRVAVGEPFVLVYGQTEDLSALVGVGTKEDGTGVFFIDQDADVVAIRRIKAILANVVDSCGFDENGRLKPFSGEIISGSSSVEDAIEELASYIKTISLAVSDTRTVDLTLTGNQGASGLTADVKVPGSVMMGSDILTNTLQVGDDGLYVYIDIAHTLGTNKFKMTINDQVKEIDLGDTVKSGVYDSARRSVVLTLNNNNKVYIDLQEFFNEFKASNIVCWLPGGEKSNLQSVVSSGGVISNFESGGETNIIRSVGGLFASVNLTYNALTNTLVFTKSDKDEVSKVTEIQLNSANILDHIYYDRAKEELVLIYHTTDGQRQEVRIPVSDLFEEWYTDNSNSTVTLIKDRSVPGYTSLKGNVNVAPLSLVPHNILQEFHNAGFHGLSVNGVAENIAYGDGTVKDALDAVGTDLSNEITARQNTDDELRVAISEEASAREAADNDLRAAITAEANARTSADNALSGAIDAEVADRMSADTALGDAISAEASAREAADDALRATDGELRAAITAEANAREAADNDLSDAISAEANARTSADTEMSGRIDALGDAITAEVSARTEADNILRGAIDAETSARTSADTEMFGRINALGDTINNARLEVSGGNAINARVEGDTGNPLSNVVHVDVNVDSGSDNMLKVTSGNALFVDVAPVRTLSGKVGNLEGQIETFSGLVEDKQDKLSAGSGVTLGDDGVTLRGVVSSGSEQYLTVGAGGFSLSGVTDAIDLAMNDAITSAKSYADSVITGVTDIHVSAVTVVTVDNGVDSEGDVVQMYNGIYLKTVFENSSNKIYTSLSSIVTFQNSDTITFNTTSGNVVTAEIGDVNGVVDCGDYYAGEDMHGSDIIGPEYGGDGPIGPYNP